MPVGWGMREWEIENERESVYARGSGDENVRDREWEREWEIESEREKDGGWHKNV